MKWSHQPVTTWAPLIACVSFLLPNAFAASGFAFTTRIGGAGITNITSIATDGTGNIYVAGWTDAQNLPVKNAWQTSSGGGTDAFVAKLDGTGAVLFCTYLGGTSDDRAYAIAVDTMGNAYIAGSTTSSDFPVGGSASQRHLAGTRNAFVAKLTAAGQVAFSTYLGGGYEAANGIAIDVAGNAYVVGQTASVSFPILNPIQTKLKGNQNGFVSVLDATGMITFSTYLGGSGTDAATAVAVDSSGNVYIAGYTSSADFPTANALQPHRAGTQTGFVLKMNTRRTLVYSTYLGGGAING
jgi:Beta-propeller repeat